MLHRLEIENFYSILESQVIDLRVANHAPDAPERFVPIWRNSTEKAPKIVAFFGPNASGKSNVLRALTFISFFVQHSFSVPAGNPLPFQRFNNTQGLARPTRLTAYMAGLEDLTRAEDATAPQCRYVYEVVIGGQGNHTVLHESLHYWPSTAARKVRVFERDAEGKVEAARMFDLSRFRVTLEAILRPNASVISTLAQLKHPGATIFRDAAAKLCSNILVQKEDVRDEQVIQLYVNNPSWLEAFNREVQRVDLGIRAMKFLPDAQGLHAIFEHEGLSSPVHLTLESHGTRQFLKIFPYILQALETGGVAVLDELDGAIHPQMLSEILQWFRDRKRNPHNAQLWISCHSVSLLESLSKEEVFFCDKDSGGRTRIYGLRDIQGVRRADNYYKKYMAGIYGAIPQIG
ncbi:MAG: AAA family ATPase [Azospirillaceae bacterium]|nr:AAA family ATPase [Azospirillaceae bacterium]